VQSWASPGMGKGRGNLSPLKRRRTGKEGGKFFAAVYEKCPFWRLLSWINGPICSQRRSSPDCLVTWLRKFRKIFFQNSALCVALEKFLLSPTKIFGLAPPGKISTDAHEWSCGRMTDSADSGLLQINEWWILFKLCGDKPRHWRIERSSSRRIAPESRGLMP